MKFGVFREMGDFIRSCENELPKDDGNGLLHTISRWQQQQDSNEFLNQLLDALGESACKPRAKASGGAAEAEMERARLRLTEIERELTDASKQKDWARVYSLVSEFSELRWDSSRLRLRSGVGVSRRFRTDTIIRSCSRLTQRALARSFSRANAQW